MEGFTEGKDGQKKKRKRKTLTDFIEFICNSSDKRQNSFA